MAEQLKDPYEDLDVRIRPSYDVQISFLTTSLGCLAYTSAETEEEKARVCQAISKVCVQVAAQGGVEALERVRDVYGDPEYLRIILNNPYDTRYLLFGPPGHGKTSLLREACKMFAKEMGLRFVNNPKPNDSIGKDDFVYWSVELGGEASTVAIKGLPGYAKDGDHMESKPPHQYAKLNQARYGLLVFDDLGNATPPVASALHGLLLEKTSGIGGIHLDKHVAIAATANLGYQADNTHAVGMSSAILGRLTPTYVRDTPMSFVTRAAQQYGGTVGRYLETFFKHHASPEAFGWLPKGQKGAVRTRGTSPRNWDQAISRIYPILSKVLENPVDMRARKLLDSLLSTMHESIHPEAAKQFLAYVERSLSKLAPIVHHVVETGDMTPEIKATYTEMLAERGVRAHSLREEFAFFAGTLCAKKYVSKELSWEGTVQRLVEAMGFGRLQRDNQVRAMDTFLESLSAHEEGKQHVCQLFCAITGNQLVRLTQEAMVQVVNVFKKLKEKEKRPEVVQATKDLTPEKYTNPDGSVGFVNKGILHMGLASDSLRDEIAVDIERQISKVKRGRKSPSMD